MPVLSRHTLIEPNKNRNFRAALRLNIALGSGATMDSRTKHDIWIMAVSTLLTVAVATIAFAALSLVH